MTKLSNEEKNKIWSQLVSEWTHEKHCPICYSTYWGVGDYVYKLTPVNEDDKPAASPVITVTCSGCGYTYLMNASSFGMSKS